MSAQLSQEIWENQELAKKISALKVADVRRESVALIEDYFFVNSDQVRVDGEAAVEIVSEFCVEGPSVIEFNLAASASLSGN